MIDENDLPDDYDPSKELLKLRDEVLENDRKNYDPRPKEIGDRVKPWDYITIAHLNGVELSDKELEEIDVVKYFVVISNTEKVTCQPAFSIHLQDLIIVNTKDNKKYRISSKYVKIL